MTRHRSPVLAGTVAALVAGALLLATCSSDEGSDATSPATEPAGTTGTAGTAGSTTRTTTRAGVRLTSGAAAMTEQEGERTEGTDRRTNAERGSHEILGAVRRQRRPHRRIRSTLRARS